MREKAMRTAGPATHPNWAIAHARDKTPDPMTAVIICALAVTKVPEIKTIFGGYIWSFLGERLMAAYAWRDQLTCSFFTAIVVDVFAKSIVSYLESWSGVVVSVLLLKLCIHLFRFAGLRREWRGILWTEKGEIWAKILGFFNIIYGKLIIICLERKKKRNWKRNERRKT